MDINVVIYWRKFRLSNLLEILKCWIEHEIHMMFGVCWHKAWFKSHPGWFSFFYTRLNHQLRYYITLRSQWLAVSMVIDPSQTNLWTADIITCLSLDAIPRGRPSDFLLYVRLVRKVRAMAASLFSFPHLLLFSEGERERDQVMFHFAAKAHAGLDAGGWRKLIHQQSLTLMMREKLHGILGIPHSHWSDEVDYFSRT